MVAKVLVLSASRYSIENPDKSRTEGVSVHYLMQNNVEATADARGIAPVKGTMPLSEWPKLVTVPGLYDVSFEMASKKDSKGQLIPTLKPVAAKFVQAVAIFGTQKAS